MWTDRYCPKCGLKLAETRDANGEIQPEQIACRNEHVWTWTVDGEGEHFHSWRLTTPS